MEDKNKNHFVQLIKIAKVLFPLLIVISLLVYYFYQHSVGILEIKIIDKKAEWASICTEDSCIEYQVFYIVDDNETLITSENIFSQLDIGNNYLVGTKGWSFAGGLRKLTRIY